MPYSKLRIKAVVTAGLCAAMTLSSATIAFAEKVPVEPTSAVVKSDDASGVVDRGVSVWSLPAQEDEGADGNVQEDASSTVATIARDGEVISFDSLSQAVESAQEGDIVTLVEGAQIALSSPVAVSGKTITIDLNGAKITRADGNKIAQLIEVASGAGLTIKDGKGTGVIESSNYVGDDSKTYAGFGVLSYGSLTVSGGTFNAYRPVYYKGAASSGLITAGIFSGTYGLSVMNGASATVEGGTFTGDSDGAIVSGEGSSLKMTGGTVTVSNPETSNKSALHVQLKAKVELLGGDILGGYGEGASAVALLSSNGAIGGSAHIKGNAGVSLFNVDSNNALNNNKDAVPSHLVMTGGSIEATSAFAVSGNNQQSATCSFTMSGGSLSAPTGTAIYWPNEGKISISGSASISGGTGIEAKMGTIEITGGTITGTGEYVADLPTDGGASPEGSAILLSTEMYSGCMNDPNLNVTITGGKLSSAKGNAVAVQNVKRESTTQTNNVIAVGGAAELSAAMANVAVVPGDEDSITLSDDGTVATVGASKTTVNVSNAVANTMLDSSESAYFSSGVSKALSAAQSSTDADKKVTVFGDASKEEVTLEKGMSFEVASNAVLPSKVVAADGSILTAGKNEDGSTVFAAGEALEEPAVSYAVEVKDADGNSLGYYGSLELALTMIQNGQTVKLLKTNSETVSIGREVIFTLDTSAASDSTCSIVAASGYVLNKSGNVYTISKYVPPVIPPTPSDKTEVEHNQDGSTTTTVTKPDGSQTITHETATGTESVVKKDKDGNVTSTEVTVSKKDAESGKVELPLADAEPGSDVEKAPEVEVKVPSSVTAEKPVQVTVPVAKGDGSEPDYGVVVFAVDEDGNETLIPKTAVDDDGNVIFEVSGDVTIKVVDNARDMPDVKETDWFAGDVVDFATARGIVNGVALPDGSRVFDGYGRTSRGMFVAMLHNLELNPEAASEGSLADVPSDAFYADAAAWALEEGILSGVDMPDGSKQFQGGADVTREQVAVFLMRYAQHLGMDVSARAEIDFPDAGEVSGFAKEAMSWAVAEGLFTGDDVTGELNPTDGAARAEVAAVLMRFINLMYA